MIYQSSIMHFSLYKTKNEIFPLRIMMKIYRNIFLFLFGIDTPETC